MKDDLGNRMKEQYENRTRYFLPRRTYTIIRLDGKAFHTFTRGFNRPFDKDLIDMMNETTKFLCENVQGCKLAYVQSDEISLVLTDFEKATTDAWYNGNIQKMCSVSTSIATAKFNELMREYKEYMDPNDLHNTEWDKLFDKRGELKLAMFDSRVFTIPDYEEVINYFIWRQQDATRNSITSVAQSLYSHNELNGKDTSDMQDMIWQKGQNWNDYPEGQKRGRCVIKVQEPKEVETPKGKQTILRNIWKIVDPPVFSKDKEFLKRQMLIIDSDKKQEKK